MMNSKKQAKDPDREPVAETRHVAGNTLQPKSKTAFAASLARGIIPHTLGEELFEGLSMMGNYAFWQAVERRENRAGTLYKHVERETFTPEQSTALMERLAGDFGREANKVVELPEMPESRGGQPLPDSIGGDAAYLSTLAPVTFE